MKTIVACVLLALASSAAANNLVDSVRSCGADIPLPTEIYVDDCPSLPCEVKNGDTVYFTMVFTPRKYTNRGIFRRAV